MRLGGMPGIRMQQSSRTVRITRIRKIIALYLKAAVQPVDVFATAASSVQSGTAPHWSYQLWTSAAVPSEAAARVTEGVTGVAMSLFRIDVARLSV